MAEPQGMHLSLILLDREKAVDRLDQKKLRKVVTRLLKAISNIYTNNLKL